MSYHQLTQEERYTISKLKQQGYSLAEIGRCLGRHRTTIWRELKRNTKRCDGYYRHNVAQEYANGRRSRTRRGSQFDSSEWGLVELLLMEKWSPEQVAGHLKLHGFFSICHETIYRHVWDDRYRGGGLYRFLRQAKKRRKVYRSRDRRGWLTGKRNIFDRPKAVENRKQIGHWEIDTVMGDIKDQHCILTLVERKTGFVAIRKLRTKTMKEAARATINIIRRHRKRFKTITADNGSEFHSFDNVEHATGVLYYFANPYHSWERGSNENLNGLIRQWLPKGKTMRHVSQSQCNYIADRLNERPRKRFGYRTPNDLFYAS